MKLRYCINCIRRNRTNQDLTAADILNISSSVVHYDESGSTDEYSETTGDIIDLADAQLSYVGTDAGVEVQANDSNNQISAAGGNDTIVALGGTDFVAGNDGDDILYGNDGEDPSLVALVLIQYSLEQITIFQVLLHRTDRLKFWQ